MSIFIQIASAIKSLKQIGGADESTGLAAGGKETDLGRNARTKKCDGLRL